ncbi:MAG: enterotoxin [Acidobacteriaceae bacterium]|nr:enterotoxin [Acidobacteriaceae bacterium]
MRFPCSTAFVFFAVLAGTVSPLVAQSVSLRAGSLDLQLNEQNNRFRLLTVHDDRTGHSLQLQDAFTIVLRDKTELRASSMQMRPIADPGSVIDPHAAMKRTAAAGETKATSSCWAFDAPSTTASFAWCLIAQPGKSYVRSLLRITAGSANLPIEEVRLLQFQDAAAKVEGTVKGSPVVDEAMFFGLEHPLSTNRVDHGKVECSLFRELPLRANQSITYSAVVGASEQGQMRRSFLDYLETERPRPYEPFLHYNSWYDLGYRNRFNEAGAIDRIQAFGQHLTVEHGVKLDSFLFDDGWDDSNTLWGFNAGFPDGFTATADAAAKFHAGIGVWLSPWGGYSQQKEERVAYGTAHGFEIQNNGYALSGPKYFDRFQKICLEMVDKYHVNQFKFDGTGNADRVFPGSAFDSDFDAAIHLIERLRKEDPKLFVNLTTGTTASPFWVFYADSIWRGGEDHDFSGVGDSRQRWMTYRDAQTYKNVVVKGPLFPLNSLMLHGIVYAEKADGLTTASDKEFAEEVHSYFGSGTQLQELYITPSLMKEKNWSALADAAKWSRAHADILKDTHWIGGDPDKLEVYGWAALNKSEGVITLRNPSQHAQKYRLHLAQTLENTTDPTQPYQLSSLWGGTKHWSSARTATVRGNKEVEIRLEPFEVLSLEAHAVATASQH